MNYNEYKDTSLGRGIRILDELANRKKLRFAEIKKFLGNISSSTVTRILKILIEMGSINKNSNSEYFLAPKIKFWGQAIPDLKSIARPYLEEINQKFKVTVNLIERSGNEIVCIDKIMDENSPSLRILGGIRQLPTPHGIGASLFFSKEELNDEKLWEEFKQIDPNNDYKYLKKISRKAFKTGYWHDPGKLCERFAAPIINDNKVQAIIGAGTSTVLCQYPQFVSDLVSNLLKAAKELSN
jgi:DNA-binding IclR family transcriptional regulator